MHISISRMFVFIAVAVWMIFAAAQVSADTQIKTCGAPHGGSCSYNVDVQGGKDMTVWGKCTYNQPGDPVPAKQTECSKIHGTNMTCYNTADKDPQPHCHCHNWAGHNHNDPFSVKVTC